MGITRRSLLQLVAGAAAGTMVTPLPWKLLDDVSIWTQNWFLTPQLIRGEISERLTTCGLCGGGCGIRVRMLGSVPLSVKGNKDQPVSHGGTCPLGMGSPQYRFHPTRIVKPIAKNGRNHFAAVELKEAISIIGKQLAKCKSEPRKGTVAVLDWRPGSAMSNMYSDFLSQLDRSYHLIAPSNQTALTSALEVTLANPPHQVGYDLENAKTVLSIGAPLFEGWNAPGRLAGVSRVWNRKKKAKRPYLIHAESNHTTQASVSDTWLAIKPGTETALALGIGHVLLNENLVDAGALADPALDLDGYKELVDQFPPQTVAEITGLKKKEIVSAAKQFAQHTPAVAIGGGGAGAGPLGLEEEIAILGLNLLVSSYGKPGGILPLKALPDEASLAAVPNKEGKPQTNMVHLIEPKKAMPLTSLAKIPNRSIRLLILDSAMPVTAIPKSLLNQKLAPDAITVSLSPYLAGATLEADVVLPSQVTYEWEYDVPTPAGVPMNTYAVSAKISEAPPGTKAPPEFMELIAKAGGVELGENAFAKHMDDRLAAIVKSGRGKVFDAKSGKNKETNKFTAADKLKKTLLNGGCWMDDAPVEEESTPFRLLGIGDQGATRLSILGRGRVATLKGNPKSHPLILMPYGDRGVAGESALPQVMTKLYRESELRQLYLTAHISPETGAKRRLTDGHHALLDTPLGTLDVTLVHDHAVMPEVVRVAVGPNPLTLGDVDDGNFASILDITKVMGGSVWRLSRASLREVHHG
jgi:anaerobic selenocysteine-containing dehydrogenase